VEVCADLDSLRGYARFGCRKKEGRGRQLSIYPAQQDPTLQCGFPEGSEPWYDRASMGKGGASLTHALTNCGISSQSFPFLKNSYQPNGWYVGPRRCRSRLCSFDSYTSSTTHGPPREGDASCAPPVPRKQTTLNLR